MDRRPELRQMGIRSVKIEGRMKRPEYVAAAVTACRQMLDTGTCDGELAQNLQSVFSRSGFTSGYYDAKRGRSMPVSYTHLQGITRGLVYRGVE